MGFCFIWHPRLIVLSVSWFLIAFRVAVIWSNCFRVVAFLFCEAGRQIMTAVTNHDARAQADIISKQKKAEAKAAKEAKLEAKAAEKAAKVKALKGNEVAEDAGAFKVLSSTNADIRSFCIFEDDDAFHRAKKEGSIDFHAPYMVKRSASMANFCEVGTGVEMWVKKHACSMCLMFPLFSRRPGSECKGMPQCSECSTLDRSKQRMRRGVRHPSSMIKSRKQENCCFPWALEVCCRPTKTRSRLLHGRL